jgi:hypothetical protein
MPCPDHDSAPKTPSSNEFADTSNAFFAAVRGEAEQLGFYEPLKVTSEFGVSLGFHF